MSEHEQSAPPLPKQHSVRGPNSIYETLIAGLPSVTALGLGSVYVLGAAAMLSRFMASGVPYVEGFLLVPTGQLLASGLSIALVLVFVAAALVVWIAAFPEIESAWHKTRETWLGRSVRVTDSVKVELDDIRSKSSADRARFDELFDETNDSDEYNQADHDELIEMKVAAQERDRRLTKLGRTILREKLIFNAPNRLFRFFVAIFSVACFIFLDVVVLMALIVAIGVVAVVEPPRRLQLPVLYVSLVGALILGTLVYEPRELPTATVTTKESSTIGHLIAFSDSQWFLHGRLAGDSESSSGFTAIPIERISETTIVSSPARQWRTLPDLVGVTD